MNKPWIDIATMAVPRLLTERCVSSFLSHFSDKADYRLRWIFHLDQYPYPGLEVNWEENMKQAITMSNVFDDALIMGSRVNQSYGESVCRVMQEVIHPVFLLEDDKLWIRDFSLRDVRQLIAAEKADSYNFYQWAVPGSTSPTFFERDVIKVLLENAPTPRREFTELDFIRIAEGKIRTIHLAEKDIGKKLDRRTFEDSYWIDAGNYVTKQLGVKKAHPATCYISRNTRCRKRKK